MGVMAWSPLAGGWLSGRWRTGTDDLPSRHAESIPHRATRAHYDMSIPGNQAKLGAATALGDLAEDAGMSLIHMALAFVRNPEIRLQVARPRGREVARSQGRRAALLRAADPAPH